MDAGTYPWSQMEDDKSKLDMGYVAEGVHKAYLKPITRFLLEKMSFNDKLQVTVSFWLISDEFEESKFTFNDTIERSSEAIYMYTKGDKSVQTDVQSGEVTSHVESVEVASQTETQKEKMTNVSVKVEKDLDTEDEGASLYDTDSMSYDLHTMKVMPSSPDNPTLNLPAGIQCPLCPLRFNETHAAEKHLKRIHDIGNIYHCTYCGSMLQSKIALTEHMAECPAAEPGQKKKKRGRKPKSLGSTIKTEGKTKKKDKPIVKPSEPKRGRGRPRKNTDAAPKVPSKPKVSETESSTDKKEEMEDLPDLLEEDIISETEEDQCSNGEVKKKSKHDPDYVPASENKRELKCSKCDNKYQSKKSLRRHFEKVHNLKRIKCDLPDSLENNVMSGTEENKNNDGNTKHKPMYDPDYVPEGENKHEVKCAKCENKYQSKRALRRHFESVHNMKRNICEVCGKVFMGKESLYHHMRGVHGNTKIYRCDQPDCDKTFNFSHSLKLHKLKHSGIRPHMCSTCGKTYLTAYHLKVHMQATHSDKKIYTCNICGKSFSYSTSLKMHERSHAKLRPNPCNKCSKAFVNAQALKYHVMAKHTESGNFKCDECGKMYKTEFLLKTHKRRHTPLSTRFMCDVCGNRYMYKSGLEMHRSVHKDEKGYSCTKCEKKFKTYPALYSHQYVHCTDEPHQCTQCGKPFKTKERLKAHEKRHSGLKPFECKICFHCFPDNGGLSKHMRTVHCAVKRFSCHICGKATSRADNLRVHMKVHYKGDINDLDQKQLKIAGETTKVSKTVKSNLSTEQHMTGLKTDDNIKRPSKDSFNADTSDSNHTSPEDHSDMQVNMNQNPAYSRHSTGLYLPHLQQYNRHNEHDHFDRSPENLSMNQSANLPPPQHLTTMPHLAPMPTEAHSSASQQGLPSSSIPSSTMVGSQPNSGPLSSLHVPPYLQYVYPGGTPTNMGGFYQ